MAGASREDRRRRPRALRGFDVQMHTGSPVAAVTPAGVRLQSGRRLRSDLTLWTGGGLRARRCCAIRGLAPKPRQWAPVDCEPAQPTFPQRVRHRRCRGLAAPLAKQAFHALEMGECAADNVQRMLAGRKLQPFSPSRTPLLVAFGDLDTFLVAGRSMIASSALAAAKEAVYQVTMAQIDPPLSAPALGQLAARVSGVTRRLRCRVARDRIDRATRLASPGRVTCAHVTIRTASPCLGRCSRRRHARRSQHGDAATSMLFARPGPIADDGRTRRFETGAGRHAPIRISSAARTGRSTTGPAKASSPSRASASR